MPRVVQCVRTVAVAVTAIVISCGSGELVEVIDTVMDPKFELFICWLTLARTALVKNSCFKEWWLSTVRGSTCVLIDHRNLENWLSIPVRGGYVLDSGSPHTGQEWRSQSA